MDLQRDSPATLVHLQGAGAAGNVKVPVAASLTASQLALASDDEAASFALLKNLVGVEVDAQFQHATTVMRRPARLARNFPKQASRRLIWPFGERLRMFPTNPNRFRKGSSYRGYHRGGVGCPTFAASAPVFVVFQQALVCWPKTHSGQIAVR